MGVFKLIMIWGIIYFFFVYLYFKAKKQENEQKKKGLDRDNINNETGLLKIYRNISPVDIIVPDAIKEKSSSYSTQKKIYKTQSVQNNFEERQVNEEKVISNEEISDEPIKEYESFIGKLLKKYRGV